jgi:hypothetical protein
MQQIGTYDQIWFEYLLLNLILACILSEEFFLFMLIFFFLHRNLPPWILWQTYLQYVGECILLLQIFHFQWWILAINPARWCSMIKETFLKLHCKDRLTSDLIQLLNLFIIFYNSRMMPNMPISVLSLLGLFPAGWLKIL